MERDRQTETETERQRGENKLFIDILNNRTEEHLNNK